MDIKTHCMNSKKMQYCIFPQTDMVIFFIKHAPDKSLLCKSLTSSRKIKKINICTGSQFGDRCKGVTRLFDGNLFLFLFKPAKNHSYFIYLALKQVSRDAGEKKLGHVMTRCWSLYNLSLYYKWFFRENSLTTYILVMSIPASKYNRRYYCPGETFNKLEYSYFPLPMKVMVFFKVKFFTLICHFSILFFIKAKT